MAVAWLLLVVTAPILWPPLAALVYAAGSLICHQLPGRSFHLQGSQLPVCARCVGLYGGSALGSLAGIAAFCSALRRWRVPPAHLHWIGTALAAVPTAVTFVLEWGFGWRISNTVRTLAAVPLGVAVAFVVVNALAWATLHYEQCAPTRPIGSSQPPTST
jgi:uncharacterized membrane protein